MTSEIILWLSEQTERSLIGSFFTEAGYDFSFVDSQAMSLEARELENWKLLFIDVETAQQTDGMVAFLEKLRRLNNCKVVVLSKSEFYPLIREGQFKIDHLWDNIIFYPISNEELIGDVRRYLEL
jgi:DNA-binding NtrC family response regulator